jgi:hypothetical protein
MLFLLFFVVSIALWLAYSDHKCNKNTSYCEAHDLSEHLREDKLNDHGFSKDNEAVCNLLLYRISPFAH